MKLKELLECYLSDEIIVIENIKPIKALRKHDSEIKKLYDSNVDHYFPSVNSADECFIKIKLR